MQDRMSIFSYNLFGKKSIVPWNLQVSQKFYGQRQSCWRLLLKMTDRENLFATNLEKYHSWRYVNLFIVGPELTEIMSRFLNLKILEIFVSQSWWNCCPNIHKKNRALWNLKLNFSWKIPVFTGLNFASRSRSPSYKLSKIDPTHLYFQYFCRRRRPCSWRLLKKFLFPMSRKVRCSLRPQTYYLTVDK